MRLSRDGRRESDGLRETGRNGRVRRGLERPARAGRAAAAVPDSPPEAHARSPGPRGRPRIPPGRGGASSHTPSSSTPSPARRPLPPVPDRRRARARRRRGRRLCARRHGVPARRAVEHGHQAARAGDRRVGLPRVRAELEALRAQPAAAEHRGPGPCRGAGRGRRHQTTRWYDLSALDGAAIDGNLLPSHTQQNELRRAWDFFVATHDNANRPNGLRGDLSERYLRRIVVLRLDREQAGGRGASSNRSRSAPVRPMCRRRSGARSRCRTSPSSGSCPGGRSRRPTGRPGRGPRPHGDGGERPVSHFDRDPAVRPTTRQTDPLLDPAGESRRLRVWPQARRTPPSHRVRRTSPPHRTPPTASNGRPGRPPVTAPAGIPAAPGSTPPSAPTRPPPPTPSRRAVSGGSGLPGGSAASTGNSVSTGRSRRPSRVSPMRRSARTRAP